MFHLNYLHNHLFDAVAHLCHGMSSTEFNRRTGILKKKKIQIKKIWMKAEKKQLNKNEHDETFQDEP